MARCSRDGCGRWRPDLLVERAGLGLRIDGQWFCSGECVRSEAARRLRSARRLRGASPEAASLRLGTVLMRQGVVSPPQVREAVEAQRQSGLRFGAQLQQLGYATRERILQGLSVQHGVPYLASIDADTVRSAPGDLTRGEVEALGLVPFRATDDSLLVACTAPVPRAAIGALEALMRRAVEPFLVADDDFARLIAAYGEHAGDAHADAMRATDVEDGASRIAALAAESRSVELTEAHLEPFTWVRIAGDGRTRTLLVPPPGGAMEAEQSWLAATTQH
jgi:hypothetical protein